MSTLGGIPRFSVLHRPWILPVSIALGAFCLLFWPLLLGDQTFFHRDVYQRYVGTARLLSNGNPVGGLLWDSFLNGGQPLLGNAGRYILYPSRALYLFLSPIKALNWEILLHVLLGGVGSAVLARRLGISRVGCAVTGVAFAFSGLSISITSLGRLVAYHWLPWIALAVHMISQDNERASFRWRMVLPILFAVLWFGAAVEIVVITSIMALAWAVVLNRRIRWRISTAGTILGSMVLAMGLAAIQIAPAAEMVLRSDRATHFSQANVKLAWSLHPKRIAEFVAPGFCGPVDLMDPSKSYWGAGLVDGGFPFFVSLYLGASIVALAVIALIASGDAGYPRSLRWLLAGSAGLGMLLAFGSFIPFIHAVLSSAPGLNLVRYPVKYALLVGVPVSLLAGQGFDILVRGNPERLRRVGRWTVSVAGVFFVLAALVRWGRANWLLEFLFSEGAESAAQGVAQPLVHTTFALAGVALVAFAAGGFSGSSRSLLLIAVVVADLFGAAAPVLLTAPSGVLSTPPQLLDLVRENIDGGRLFRDVTRRTVVVAGPEDPAWMLALWRINELDRSVAATWGVPMAFYFDIETMSDSRMVRLAHFASDLDWQRRLNLFQVAAVTLSATPNRISVPGLERAASHAISQNLHINLYRTVTTPAMVRWVPWARSVDSQWEALEALANPEFDPTHEVIREAGAAVTMEIPSWLYPWLPKVELWRGELFASDGGYAVTAIPWHPGLILEVDGKNVPVERINYAFSGTDLGAGRHQFRVIFAPRSVAVGGILSLISFMIWIGICIGLWRGRSRAIPAA